MYTLHIEHSVTTVEAWKAAFDRFAPLRQESGARQHRIHRPIDDPAYVLVDLDFDTAEAAAKFLDFLQTRVWSSPQNAPALVGMPQTMILELVAEEATV